MLVTGSPHTPLGRSTSAGSAATGTPGSSAAARGGSATAATGAGAGAGSGSGSGGGMHRAPSAVRLRPLSPLRQQQTTPSARQQQQQQQQQLPPPDSAAPTHPVDTRRESDRDAASASGSVCASCGSAVATAAAATTAADHVAEARPSSALYSVHAPASLDEYVALQTQQSSRGLELVYGLKIELSKLVEELSDRYPEGHAQGQQRGPGPPLPRLPYRVVGHGGMLWWQEVREGKRLPPAAAADAAAGAEGSDGAAAATAAAAAGAGGAVDPFATFLPSLRAPPPPLTPSTVLPALVLLNMLRVGVRSVLSRAEDQTEELQEQLAASEAERARLAALLEQATATATSATAAPAPWASPASSPPGSPVPRVRTRKTVQFNQEHLGSFAPAAAAATAAQPTAAATTSAAAGDGWELMSPPFSPTLSAIVNAPSSSSSSSVIAAAAPPPLEQLGPAALQQLPSSGNWTREDALSRALLHSESSLARWKGRARAALDQVALAQRAHQEELASLKASLEAKERLVAEQGRALTQRAVLLQLESIARRERDARTQEMQRYFAAQMKEWEAEVKELLHPRRERLFVRKVDHTALGLGAGGGPGGPATGVAGFASAMGTGGGGRTPAPQGSRSTKKKGGTTPALLASPPPERTDSESKEEQRLVPAVTPPPPSKAADSASSFSSAPTVDPASQLYPSPASPLATLQQSMKTPAGRQWLGKMLSPPPSSAAAAVAAGPVPSPIVVEKDALVIVLPEKKKSSSVEGGGAGGGSGTTQGHLVAGADLLACDLLLVLDALFRAEYASLSRDSVELSRQIRFAAELDARREQIQGGHRSNSSSSGSSGGAGTDKTGEGGADPSQSSAAGSGVSGHEIGPDGCPTPAALAALLSSIPAASLAYLQSLQRLFLSLYARLPASVQARFAKLQSGGARAATVDILHPRLRDTMQAGAAAAALDKKEPSAAAGGGGEKPQAQEPSVWAQNQLQAVMDDLRGPDAQLRSGTAAALAPMQAPSLQSPAAASAAAQSTGSAAPAAATAASAASVPGVSLIAPTRATILPDSFAPLASASQSLRARDRHPPHSLPSSSSAALSAAVSLALPSAAASAAASGSATPVAGESSPMPMHAATSSGGGERDASAYLARLELILHKVRALANFRGVVLNI